MRKILFVDDEQKVLDGLRRMLRPMREQWDMVFAKSGEEALELLAGGGFHVIVSDMRMPGMDGAALLAEVTRRNPELVRIVLSGQAAEEEVIRSVGAAHQYLSKPCDADVLKRTIERAFNLRCILENESLKKVISQTKTLPSLPTLYAEINEELQYPDASTRKLGEIISKDPGMTAKVLQLVNSSFFGVSRRVSSPVDAVALLGTQTLRSLVLSSGIFSAFEDVKIRGLDAQALWAHCAQVGVLARQIAVAEKAPNAVADDAMMAGLLHDAGKLILADNLPDLYSRVLAAAAAGKKTLCELERESVGAAHAEVGAYLLGLWGLPDPIVEAVLFHHCPDDSFDHRFGPLTAVYVANIFDQEVRSGDLGSVRSGELDLDYLKRLGLADRIALWREACQMPSSAEVTA